MADPTSWAEIESAISGSGHGTWQNSPNAKLTLREMALIWVLIEEFNALRALHGLPDRTLEQAISRLRTVFRVMKGLNESDPT